MIVRHTRDRVTWIDVESPTKEELREVMKEFSIDERIEDEIVNPTPYPLFIPFPDYVYAVLHFPTADPAGGSKNQEMDFIVGKEFIITARYEVIDSIHNLHKVFEAEELLGYHRDEVKTPVLLERIFRRLYGALGHEAEQAALRLEKIEKDIFSGRERETVRAISDVGRTLLRFDTTLARHAEPLSAFISELSSPDFFGKKFREHGAHIEAERSHAAGLIASYRAVARELRSTNDSLLSTSQNEVVKTLTVIAFITSPPILIAGIFGMNTDSPIAEHPDAFWLVLSLMAISSLTVYVSFRIKKWL